MSRQAMVAVIALALCGGAQAQSNEELKATLDQALKTIQELQGRVKALEQQKPAPVAGAPAPTTAAASTPSSTWGAPLVSVGTRAEDASLPDSEKARVEFYGQAMIDAIYDFRRMNPDFNATERPSQIPVNCPGDAGCGKDGASDLQRAAVQPRLQGVHPDRPRVAQDRSQLRPVRLRRQHQHPLAQRLGRDRHIRRRANVLELHGHRRVPEHDRLLGSERHGLRAQPAIARHAVEQGRHEPGVLARGTLLGARHRQDQRHLA